MMKKFLCLALALFLCAAVPALAEEAPAPVTEAELTAFAAGVLEQVLAETPLNNPKDESSRREDGIFFQFETASVYAAADELARETPVNALVFTDSEEAIFRGVGIDTQWSDLLAAFPLENETLAGTKEAAMLYLYATGDGGYTYGRILRDGQRISAAEYGQVLPAGSGFRRASVTFSLQNGLVTSIRFDGLNPETAEALDTDQAAAEYAALEAMSRKIDYRAVKSSRNGLELTPFGEEDLVFDGIDFLSLQPDTLPGTPERDLFDNEDGTWLMRCDGDGYEAVFSCDALGGNAAILSFSILDGGIEGPRCVRLGDLFADDFNRFRNGENDVDENMTEILYGMENIGQRGFANYDTGSGETSLRYVTPLSAGGEVELLLKFEQNTLTEIILHTI